MLSVGWFGVSWLTPDNVFFALVQLDLSGVFPFVIILSFSFPFVIFLCVIFICNVGRMWYYYFLMKLDSNQLELLETFANDNDYNLRTDYSGRGMYGKTCIGFDTDRGQNLFSLGIDLARFLTENKEYDLLEAFQNTTINIDSMGMGQIVYFPRMEIEIDKEDDFSDTLPDEPDALPDDDSKLGASLDYDFTGKTQQMPEFELTLKDLVDD